MSVLNKKITRVASAVGAVANQKAGGRQLGVSKNGNLQFSKAAGQQLFEAIVSTLYGKDSFYESGNARVERAKKALAEVVASYGLKGIEYAARVIYFARSEMHVRTMPIVMAVELMKLAQAHNARVDQMIDAVAPESPKLAKSAVEQRFDVDLAQFNRMMTGEFTEPGTDMVNTSRAELIMAAPKYTEGRKLIAAVIRRADELTDLYAYALTVFGEKGKVPVSLKRGVADAFQKFDGYQLSKYNRDGQITMKRLLRIVHASPKDEVQSEVFKKIMSETLEPAHTWEVIKSENGQKSGAEKLSDKQLWTDLVAIRGPGEMGYMGLLRNLRNIFKAGVDDEVLRAVANRIADPKEVARSKQLPWAFINVYEVMKAEKAPQVLVNAVISAAELSLGNMPPLGDRPWVILDCSSSMKNYTDAKLREQEAKKPAELQNSPIKVGAIFAAALAKSAKNSTYFRLSMFSDRAEFVDLNVHDSIISLYKQIMAKVYGGGTQLDAALRQRSQLGYTPDAIVVISDMEVNPLKGGYCLQVPKNATEGLPADCVKVALNVNSSTTTPLDPRDGWIQLAGWSENIFRFVDYTRNAQGVAEKLFNGELGEYR